MRAQLDLVNIWCVSEWNGLFQFILKVGGELVFDWSTGIALCTSPYFCHSDTANIGAYVAPRHTNHVCCSPIGTHSLTHQTILTIAISLRSIGPQVSMNLQCVPFLLSWHYFNWPFDKSFTLTPHSFYATLLALFGRPNTIGSRFSFQNLHPTHCILVAHIQPPDLIAFVTNSNRQFKGNRNS